jgi:magnesium chelatase subunit D
MGSNIEERGRIYYPFTAIVGNEDAKLALILNAIDPDIGGVLLVGDKGTGKSTMVRSLAQVLPEIEVVADCPFNDDPNDPTHMCDICHSRYVKGEQLPVVKRRMRVVNLPLSITVDRLVGTIDIKRALKEGIRALQPGLLAEANRNILYIDEVNLLDDYIANLLLDVAASGWNIIEREGLSFRHPAKFVLVGSMNPEEGELRPQLLDRFGLYVRVEAGMNPEERVELVRRVEEFRRDPVSFYRKFEPLEEELRGRIEGAKALLKDVEIDDDLLRLIAKTITEMGIKTHRAEITVVRAAKALAAFNGRRRVELEDVRKAMELALPHRVKARPFSESANYNEFKNAVRNLLEGKGSGGSTSNNSGSSQPRSLSGSPYDNINDATGNSSHGSSGLTRYVMLVINTAVTRCRFRVMTTMYSLKVLLRTSWAGVRGVLGVM